jgi:hypothetical protein
LRPIEDRKEQLHFFNQETSSEGGHQQQSIGMSDTPNYVQTETEIETENEMKDKITEVRRTTSWSRGTRMSSNVLLRGYCSSSEIVRSLPGINGWRG